jgi:hypothetical protein
MQIKNILLATLFVATTQVFCVDEQTDAKAKLRAELDAKIEAKYEVLANLSKKITEQEAIVQTSTNKYRESFIKYTDWQNKKDTENNIPIRNEVNAQEDFIKQLSILQNALSNSTKNGTKIRDIPFDEDYKKDNKADHELLIYHIFAAGLEIIALNKFIAKWKICFEEVADLEEQLNVA